MTSMSFQLIYRISRHMDLVEICMPKSCKTDQLDFAGLIPSNAGSVVMHFFYMKPMNPTRYWSPCKIIMMGHS